MHGGALLFTRLKGRVIMVFIVATGFKILQILHISQVDST